jgi:Zn-dependent protease
MRGSLTLGKIFGIPIKLHTSWFLVAALVTWSLAGSYFPQEYPGWATTTYWAVGAVTAVLFFTSVLLHELGHSVVALREKVPVRNITLFIFGGVAQIGSEPPTAGAEFRIAIMGPLTSLALAGLSGLLSLGTAGVAPLAASAAYLARINLMLAAFNLIPGFPLDGGRVLRAVLWGLGGSLRTATWWASRVGRGVAYLFILLGVGQMFLGGFLNGLWIQQCVAVPSDLQLDRLVADHVLGEGHRCFFVADNGNVKGLITLNHIRAVPRDRREQLTVGQVMAPVDALLRTEFDEDVLALLQRMDEAGVNQVPVLDNGHLLGMITRGNLLHYMQLRSELGV